MRPRQGTSASGVELDPARSDETDRGEQAAVPEPGLPPAPLGPQFRFRARLLWALVAIFQFGAAVVLLGLTLNGSLVGILPAAAPVVLLAFGLAFLAPLRPLGRGERWAVAPTQTLAVALILGGLARFALSFAVPPIQIPLEPLLGAFVLLARDAPSVVWRRPSDWRTAAASVLVVAMELPLLAPALPASLPVLSSLSSGPEALDLSIINPCPPIGVPWQRVGLEVRWAWRGMDVGGSAPDALTIHVEDSGASDVTLDPLDGVATALTSMEMPDPRTVTLGIPRGTRSGDYPIQAVQGGDGAATPITVTATYRHAGRWEVAQTQGCQP